MKTIALNLNSVSKILLVALTFVFALTSCSDDDKELNPAATSTDIVAVPFFVQNADQELPSDDADLLYESRTGQPLLAPNGDQVTWGEFAGVKGSVEVECTEGGTRVALDLTGLIPNGVYTIWNLTVKEPGFDPTAEMFNITGIGAAGSGLGEDNIVVASATGTAKIETISPGGAMSMFGEIATCSLTDEYEWHVVGAYHIDGNTYGPDLGPDGTVTEQFGFIFTTAN